MKIIVKKLQGGECEIEVLPTTTIYKIKKDVAVKLNIPVEEQKLLHLGRNLVDEQTIQSYPAIKEGSKINLVVKKPEGLYEVSLKHFRKCGMSETEAISTAKRFLKIVQEKFNKLSWDDIERLSLDCMMDENGENRTRVAKPEVDSEEGYGL